MTKVSLNVLMSQRLLAMQHTLFQASEPMILKKVLLLAVPRRLFCFGFGSLAFLVAVFRYLSLFLLSIYKKK